MPATLLLADDSVTIQRIIQLTFANEDVRVVVVGDGESAVQCIDAERPDIVLADIGMPHLDGYGVASHIKQSPGLGDIPVLLLTGAFEPIDEDRARATGCDGVLVKPFDPQQLVERVKELLAGHRSSVLWPAARPRVDGATSLSPQPLASASVTPPAFGAVTESTLVQGAAQAEPSAHLAPDTSPESGTDMGQIPEPGALGKLPEEPKSAFEMEFDQLDASFSQFDQAAPTTLDQEPASDFAAELDTWRDPIGRQETPGGSGTFGDWDIPDDAVSTSQHHDVADSLSIEEPRPGTSDTGPARAVTPDTFDRVGDAGEPPLAPDSTPPDAAESAILPHAEQPEPPMHLPPHQDVSEAWQPDVDSLPVPDHAAGTMPESVPPRPSAAAAVSLGSAFSALLAAERAQRVALPSPAAPAISEAMFEEIIRRVLSRMTEESIRRLIIDTAERVVRQEVDRIRTDPHSGQTKE